MRTLFAAVIGVTMLAIAPTSAFAHHNIQHSIVVARQTEPCVPHAAGPSVSDYARQFATNQRGPLTRTGEHANTAAHDQMPPCEGTGTIIAVTNNTVTVRHTAIASHHWPAMTMTFAVTDPQSLDGLKVGDTVGFDIDDGATAPTINRIMKH